MRLLALVVVAGCGRVGFAETPPDVATGHDEDGDGVPDRLDPCPWLADDTCDQSLTRLAFYTLQPGDQPFVQTGGSGTMTQLADSIAIAGDDMELRIELPTHGLDVWVGFAITAVHPDVLPYQITISARDASLDPNIYAELYQDASHDYAGVSEYDGMNYFGISSHDLPPLHVGEAALHLHDTPTHAHGDVGYAPAYTSAGLAQVDADHPDFGARTGIDLYVHDLDVEVRYLAISAAE